MFYTPLVSVCIRVCVCLCDYDIDIHVRPPTLLMLAARENRVNDIPTVLHAYTYIHGGGVCTRVL